MLRLLRLTLLVGVLALLGVPTATAGRTLGLPNTLTSAHFQVHYDGSADYGYRINVMQANDLAAWAERAYAAYVSWGYLPPLNDGDGYSDIYVTEMPAKTWGAAESDSPFALTSSAFATVHGQDGVDERKIAHLVFHLFQAASWNPLDSWLREGGAEWAAFRLLGFPASVYADESDEMVPVTEYFARTAIPLDCVGEHCGDTIYEQGNYQAWPFFTYLGERYGTQVVKDVHDRGPASGDPSAAGLDFLSQVLATKATTLADVFNDWTVAAMTGRYAAPGLKGSSPQIWTTMSPGAAAGPLAPIMVPVNHLSVRYVGVQRGGSGTGPCHPATLTLSVTIPSGVASRPHFLWPAAEAVPVPLAVSGSNATLSIPWDTCESTTQGLLSLPNDSRSIDGTEFRISGNLAVDKNTIVTATPPPSGSYDGPTVPAEEAEAAPAIALYGPSTLRVSKRAKTVRLVVFSSGQGQLEVGLGSTILGKRVLRAGNNDVRFTLPRGAARRLLTARSVLTVTSLSSAGNRGATINRKLVFTK